MNICAPNKYDSDNQTCFSLEQLVEMTKAYNRYITKNKLSPINDSHIKNFSIIKIKDDKPYLLKELLKRFKTVCQDNEICLTKQDFMNEIVKEMKDDIINNTFRPTGPTDPKEWLSTIDINNIMKQYEEIYPDFKFFGAVPLDCNELNFCPLYKLDYDKYSKKYKKLAIIFNHDKYGQPGSHWVALYIDINHGKIYFCDSTGRPPINNINKIIEDFMKFYKKTYGSDADYQYNTKEYQTDGSECGIYSCNFIIRMLAGESFEDVIKNSLSFEQINSCRNVYFNNRPSKFQPNKKCDPTYLA